MKKLILSLFVGILLPVASMPCMAELKHTEDVIYGRKFGVALTMDVFQPEQPNGAAVLFVVSGGWVSNHDIIKPNIPVFIAPFTDRGYTVFAVCHACQPKFQIPEIIQDMQRSVRFIKAHAKKYGIDPNKIGVTGGSAGGHLSLILGTKGHAGDPSAKDPIDQQDSFVQAVACFYPPTDFLNYNKPNDNAVGFGTLKDFKPAFGSKADTEEGRAALGKEISPIYYLTEKTPPTMIIHGDADTLVPIYQAQIFIQKAEELKVPARLITKPGKGHGWDIREDMPSLADWFDKHLLGKGK